MPEPFVVYQGTFDPFTTGHLAVLTQALERFGSVRILLLINPDKQPLFSLQQRKDIIAAATAHLSGVSIDSYPGLLVEYMRAHGVQTCVRGVRSEQDRTYEMHNHRLSKALYPALQTVLLDCPAQYKEISSSAVKAACAQGRLPAGWVCPQIMPFLKKQFPALELI